MIEARVRKRLGDFLLDGEINDAGFICLTGVNGSGKSSLLKVVAGLTAPDEGFVRVNSKDITRLPIEKREVVLVSPDSSLPHLDVPVHLLWGARARGMMLDEDYVNEVKGALGISFGGRVKELSLGMRERVALATALLSRPRVILVDEAFANLDDRDQFIQNYRKLSKEAKVDVIFATQAADTEGPQVDHLYRMVMGRSTRVR